MSNLSASDIIRLAERACDPSELMKGMMLELPEYTRRRDPFRYFIGHPVLYPQRIVAISDGGNSIAWELEHVHAPLANKLFRRINR